MANSNRTEIYIEGSKEAIDNFVSDMILEIYRQMAKIDDEIKVSGKYWDETYNPIGVFEVYYGEIFKEEQDIDGDQDQEYFWDDVVEPVFTVLQEKLDKVMDEI